MKKIGIILMVLLFAFIFQNCPSITAEKIEMDASVQETGGRNITLLKGGIKEGTLLLKVENSVSGQSYILDLTIFDSGRISGKVLDAESKKGKRLEGTIRKKGVEETESLEIKTNREGTGTISGTIEDPEEEKKIKMDMETDESGEVSGTIRGSEEDENTNLDFNVSE